MRLLYKQTTTQTKTSPLLLKNTSFHETAVRITSLYELLCKIYVFYEIAAQSQWAKLKFFIKKLLDVNNET